MVNNTNPIWFYCSAPDSCKKYKMVGVINIDSSKNTLQSVKKAASEVDFSLSPGEPIPSDSSQSGATPSASSTTPSSGSTGGSSALSGGAVAGIVIGAIGAFALVGLLFFLVGRKKKADEVKEKAAADAEAAANAQTPAPDHSQPPTYQDGDPRYSMVPGSPPPQDNYYGAKPGHASLMPDGTSTTASLQERNPHRMSELPSQNYDPVELYTPGPEQQTFPRGSGSAADDHR